MNSVFAAALDIQRACEERRWRFCFIGGVAVQRWGRPRFTEDVDLTLLTGFGNEETFIRDLLATFLPRRIDAAEFALRHRVLLLSTKSGVSMDVALGALPFEERCVQRASPFSFVGRFTLLTCGGEDLIVQKCFANRELDWTDVDNILARQLGKLDLDLVRTELKPLVELKGEPEILGRLERRIAHHDQPFRRIKPLPPGPP